MPRKNGLYYLVDPESAGPTGPGGETGPQGLPGSINVDGDTGDTGDGSASSPDDKTFLWGASTASYQVEGIKNGIGKGATVWDGFLEANDVDDANVACNSYNQYKDDIKAVKTFNGNSYRFSIAWTRIFPNGKAGEEPLPDGVRYYHDVIDECLKHDITPVVCLFHWDLPQSLVDEYNGLLCDNGQLQKDFTYYADFCFSQYGDKVKYWATINEPQTIAVDAYEYNWQAPGTGNADGDSPDGPEYKVAHNLLLCHAYAVDNYRKKYKQQNGKIAIICNCDWAEPLTNSPENIAASERRNVFWYSWYNDPIFFGDYPQLMKDLVGDRLPTFTLEEKKLLQGSIDMVLLNTYTTSYIYHQNPHEKVGWMFDQQTTTTPYSTEGVIVGAPSAASWLNVVPWGPRKLMLWIQQRYSFDGCGTGIGIQDNNGKRKLPMMITENGMPIKGEDEYSSYNDTKNDLQRIRFYEGYFENVAEAVKIGGIDFAGYFPWALLDNLEWTMGYSQRFGLFYVNCNQPDTNIARKPKDSVYWYKNYIKDNPTGPSVTRKDDCHVYDLDIKSSTPWSGGVIKGYYYWHANYYEPPYISPLTDNNMYSLDTVTIPQSSSGSNTTLRDIGFTSSKQSSLQYSSEIISESDFNSIFLFSQYTNFKEIKTYANLSKMYNNALSYFEKHNTGNFLLGLCFGGGVLPSSATIGSGAGNGLFTLGPNGSFASIYEALTPVDERFSYVQSDGVTITVMGTGEYKYGVPSEMVPMVDGTSTARYNCIYFDIELAEKNGPSPVQTSDFINLYQYVKLRHPDMIIITGISHSCSYYIPEISTELLESNLSDYISPMLYSQMFGTANEYISNSGLSWEGFFDKLKLNSKFIKYGLNYLLPSVYAGYPITTHDKTTLLGMYDNGGSNDCNPPNFYYYQSSSNADEEVVLTRDHAPEDLGFITKDEGAVSFFNQLSKQYALEVPINTSEYLGGFIQWSNYKSTPATPPPAPPSNTVVEGLSKTRRSWRDPVVTATQYFSIIYDSTIGKFTLTGPQGYQAPTCVNGVNKLSISTNNDAVIFGHQDSGVQIFVQTVPPPVDTTKLMPPNGFDSPPKDVTIYNPDFGAGTLYFMTNDYTNTCMGVNDMFTITYDGTNPDSG